MDPQKILHDRFMARKITSKKFEKMEKFLEKNNDSKIKDPSSEFIQNLEQISTQYALGEFDEKEFKNRKKILEKKEKNTQKEEKKKNSRGLFGWRKKKKTEDYNFQKPEQNTRQTTEKPKSGGMKKCTKCGFVDSGNFCPKCGKKFPEESMIDEKKINCPHCGFLDSGNFCSHCGGSLKDTRSEKHLVNPKTNHRKKQEETVNTVREKEISNLSKKHLRNSHNVEQTMESAVELFLHEKYEESLEILSKILRDDPENLDALELQTACLPQIGLELQKNGKMEQSIDIFRKTVDVCDQVLRIDPNNERVPEAKRIASEFLNGIDEIMEEDELITKAIDLLDNAKYEEAIPVIDEVIQRDPDDDKAYYFKGVAHGLLSQDGDAIYCFNKAVKLAPEWRDDVEYHWRYAHALFGLKNYEESLEYIETALEIDPNHVESWYSKATTLALLGANSIKNHGQSKKCFSESLDCYDKVLELNPDHDGALSGKAELLKLLKNISN